MLSRTEVIAIPLAAFVLPVFLFPTLHRAHEYYHLENGIFLLAAIAAALSALPERARVIATMGVVALQVIAFETTYRPMLAWTSGVPEFGRFIEQHTKPDDVLLIMGMEYNPALPYYAHRKAVMCAESLAPLSVCLDVAKTAHIGVVIDCRGGPCQIRFLR